MELNRTRKFAVLGPLLKENAVAPESMESGIEWNAAAPKTFVSEVLRTAAEKEAAELEATAKAAAEEEARKTAKERMMKDRWENPRRVWTAKEVMRVEGIPLKDPPLSNSIEKVTEVLSDHRTARMLQDILVGPRNVPPPVEEWVYVETVPVEKEEPKQSDWQEYVDPSTDHAYWYNAKDGRSSWEPPSDEIDGSQRREAWLEQQKTDTLRSEIEDLRAIQSKFLQVVTAMHDRFADLDKLFDLKQRVDDLEKQALVDDRTKSSAVAPKKQQHQNTESVTDAELVKQYAAEKRPTTKNKKAADPGGALDDALAKAMRAEE